MMIPQTIFEIHDETKSNLVFKDSPTPLFFMAFSSDKGPEEIKKVQGDEFFKLYGKNISFERHGQPLLQAANIIDNGGVMFAKRIVAEDATLANLALVAKVKKQSAQKKDAKGNLLYKDASGKETTTADKNTAIMVNVCKIEYELKSTTNAKGLSQIVASVGSTTNDDSKSGDFIYPLFIFADTGRGATNKKVRILPNYEASRYSDYVKYNLNIIEDNQLIENIEFTFNPDIIEKDRNIGLQSIVNMNSKQVKCKFFEDSAKLFIKKVAEISGNSYDYCMAQDVLFGTDKYNNKLKSIEITPSKQSSISYEYGIDLANGSNGAFKDSPVSNTAEYEKQLVKIFNGEFTTDIYEYDTYPIDAIVDANYPDKVKRAIEALVTFREDIFYFRDLGIFVKTADDIVSKVNNTELVKNRYCATYHNSYDVIDPYTKKQVRVTIGYSLVRLLINHFKNGRNRPLAGLLYNMGIPEAIEGTVNFIPKITPLYNQKRTMVDNRINYAGYYDGILTLETLYTSQEQNTQLSYINNVLAIQEIIKAVRKRCPKIRYSFLEGKDLEGYKKDVQAVLNKYSSGFRELKLQYVEDQTMVANKIFYATISVKFKDFVQTEYFKLYALN